MREKKDESDGWLGKMDKLVEDLQRRADEIKNSPEYAAEQGQLIQGFDHLIGALIGSVKKAVTYTPDPEPDIDSLSIEQLAVLQEHLEAEITELKGKIKEWRDKVSDFQETKNIPPILSDIVPTIDHAKKKLRDKQSFLLKVKLKRHAPKPKLQGAVNKDPEQDILEQISQLKKKLKKALENDPDPEMQDEIKRVYGKKIDRLREQL